MENKLLKINSFHDDKVGFCFCFKVDLEYQEVKKAKKSLYKSFTEDAIACYMTLTGDNFLLKHNQLLDFLNKYRLSKFIKVTKVLKSTVNEYPLLIEETENSVKYTRDLSNKRASMINPSLKAEQCIKKFGFEEANRQD